MVEEQYVIKLEDSLRALFRAIPLDEGDWPLTDGDAAVSSLRRWVEEGCQVEEWGDDVAPDSIVGIIAGLKRELIGELRSLKTLASAAGAMATIQHCDERLAQLEPKP